MVKPRGDAGQIANTVTVRIGKAARINLVDNSAAPPCVGKCRWIGQGALPRSKGSTFRGYDSLLPCCDGSGQCHPVHI